MRLENLLLIISGARELPFRYQKVELPPKGQLYFGLQATFLLRFIFSQTISNQAGFGAGLP
jgi:hypothetical protein